MDNIVLELAFVVPMCARYRLDTNRKTNKKEKGFYTKNGFLINFHREKTEIYNRLIEDTKYFKKYGIKSTNTKNPVSSKLNKLFCVQENLPFELIFPPRQTGF